MVEEAQGMERSLLYGVTALGEAFQQRAMMSVFSRQLLQQHPGLLQVSGVKALGEPAIKALQNCSGDRTSFRRRGGTVIALVPFGTGSVSRPWRKKRVILLQ